MPALSPFFFLLMQYTVHHVVRYGQLIVACLLASQALPDLATALAEAAAALHGHFDNRAAGCVSIRFFFAIADVLFAFI